MNYSKHLVTLLCFTWLTIGSSNGLDIDCNVDPDLVTEIKGYQETVDAIMDYVINGEYKGRVYDTLQYFTDTFGSRLVGSSALQDSIDWIMSESQKGNMDIVELETLSSFNWTRNEESLHMLSPRQQKLEILGLGSTVATPEGGLTAEVLVVTDFDDLQANAEKVPGKIVLYNYNFVLYGVSVEYRARGAAEAAKLGAAASLIASVTPFSLNTPHTGGQAYSDGEDEIPSGAITPADSDMIHRIIQQGDSVTLHLVLQGQMSESEINIYNTIIGRRGYEKPEEIVLISGHIDSWDAGQGVMDDGGGVIMSWQSLFVLRDLGLVSRRSIHSVLFTAEEQGIIGGIAYHNNHGSDYANYQLLLESDLGTFAPRGLAITGSNESLCIMQEVLNLMTAVNATTVTTPTEGTDIYPWIDDGVPVGALSNENEKYFWYHHSPADTMEVYEPWMLDHCTAFWAAVAYVTADMSVHLPIAQPANR